jgi:hypothetical protein
MPRRVQAAEAEGGRGWAGPRWGPGWRPAPATCRLRSIPAASSPMPPGNSPPRRFRSAPIRVGGGIWWVQGADVVTGRAAHLPAECVHALSALPQRLQAGACTASSSSGVAAFTDPQEALSRATLELLERDAVLRRWLAGKPAPLVDPATLPHAARRRIRGWPGHAPRGRVAVPCGAGSGLQRVRAVAHPAVRGAHRGRSLRLRGGARPRPGRGGRPHRACAGCAGTAPGVRLAHVHTIEDLARFWQTRRSCRRADFYAAGAANERFGASAAHARCWPELRDRLLARGARMLAFDITPGGSCARPGPPAPARGARLRLRAGAGLVRRPAGAGGAGVLHRLRGARRRRRRLLVHPLT